MSEPASRRTTSAGTAAWGITRVLLLLVGVEAVDGASHHRLDQLGITAHDAGDLWSVVTAPFMHASWTHLAGNALPLWVFGFLILLAGGREFWRVCLWAGACSGLAAWLLSPPGSNTLGASGVIFGMLTYLLLRGIWTRRPGQIAVAVVVFLLFGGLLWGVLPSDPHVSWQAHLGGAVGGVLAARGLRGRSAARMA